MSPSLRGSGLKLHLEKCAPPHWKVSLFTREWIEMAQINLGLQPLESPSLRGSGLKFFEGFLYQLRYTSPSLRGSGLKLSVRQRYFSAFRLPLYEGVD